MLDLQFIRENSALVKKAIEDKHTGADPEVVDRVIGVDEQRRAAVAELQTAQTELNASSKQIGQLMGQGQRDEAQALIARTGELKARVQELEDEPKRLDDEQRRLLLEIPNVPHESVPVGATPDDNEVAFEWGEVPRFDFEPKPHWELAEQHGLIDFERGAKVTGAGFPFYIGKGAQLQRALVHLFLDLAAEEGYTEMQPPLVINEASGVGTGQIPDKEGQMYGTELNLSAIEDQFEAIIADSDGTDAEGLAKRLKDQIFEESHNALYLIPTAEVPVTNFYRDEILDADALPTKFAAYTPCFRREAGSYGKDVRGLNRLHQFDKVELVQFVHPEKSYEALDHLRDDAERAVQALGLPYRRLLMCTGDMGFTQSKKYDLEVWSAGQDRWLEVSSVSNFEAFQARRANIRFRPADGGKPQFVHTLNGSALALPRIVAALLENNQQADGSIAIPEALRTYTGFDRIG